MEHVAPLHTSKPYRQVSEPEHHRENPAGHVCWMGARPVPGSSPRCPGRPCTGASPFGSVDQPPFVVVPLTPHLWLSVIFLPPPPAPLIASLRLPLLPTPTPPPSSLLGSSPGKKICHSKFSSTCKKVPAKCRSPSYTQIFVECSSPFTRLTEHLTALPLGARDVCLVGENLTCPVPALYIGMRGSVVTRDFVYA